jgi:hypothetical protein
MEAILFGVGVLYPNSSMTRSGSARIPLPILSQRRDVVAPTEVDQLEAHLGWRRRPLAGLVDHAEQLGPNLAVSQTTSGRHFAGPPVDGGEEPRPYRKGERRWLATPDTTP